MYKMCEKVKRSNFSSHAIARLFEWNGNDYHTGYTHIRLLSLLPAGETVIFEMGMNIF